MPPKPYQIRFQKYVNSIITWYRNERNRRKIKIKHHLGQPSHSFIVLASNLFFFFFAARTIELKNLKVQRLTTRQEQKLRCPALFKWRSFLFNNFEYEEEGGRTSWPFGTTFERSSATPSAGWHKIPLWMLGSGDTNLLRSPFACTPRCYV